MLQMCLKYPYLFLKHVRNYIRASDTRDYDIFDTHPLRGGRPAPPPKLKSLISPLRSWDQCNFIHCCKLSILWKFEQDWTILRGVLAWSAISLYPRHLHSQYMYFGLNMYFLSNTLLNSLLQVPTLAHQVVYWLTCALLGKFWEHLNPLPATPITGLLELQSPPPRELEQMRNCGINFIYIYMFVYAISFN